jgi:hypothetical protein
MSWVRKMKEYGTDNFSNERARAFVRSRSQAWYRKEQWDLTRPEFFRFWHTPALWNQRGRAVTDLVLTRRDYTGPWSRDNCCIITRYNHLLLKSAIRWNKDTTIHYEGCLLYDPNV